MFKYLSAVLVFLAPVLGAFSAGVAAPIPSGPDAPTLAAWLKQLGARERRHADDYRKYTRDPEKVREAAAALLTTEARQSERQQHRSEAFYGQANQVLAAGSKDPLILRVAGWAAYDTGRFDEANARFNEATAAVDASAYPAEIKFTAYAAVQSSLFSTRKFSSFDAVLKPYIAHAVPWLIEQSGRAENPRFMWSLLSRFMDSQDYPATIDWQKEFLEALQAADKSPSDKPPPKTAKIDPWLMNMVAGCYYRNLAWHHRGSGWASSVTEEGGRLFQENLAIAEKHFVKAWEINPKLPAAPSAMIAIAMATDGDTRQWFDRTVAAELDYRAAYNALTWSLRPRWGGSHTAMYSFGLECANTKRFDTDVPFTLIDVLINIDEELGDKGDVWRKRGVYENVKRVLDGMEQDPSHADEVCNLNNHSWTMSLGAAIAIHAGKYDDSRQLLDRLGKNVRADAFQRRGLSYPQDAARAYALSGSVREDVARFEDLLQEKGLQDGEARRAAGKLLDAAAAKNPDAAAKPYFDSRKTLIDWYDRFDRGDWVDLKFDTKLLWVVKHGEWKLENEHSIVGRSMETQRYFQARLDCRTEFRIPMEIELDLECLRQTSVMHVMGPHAGLLAGCSVISHEDSSDSNQGPSSAGSGWLFWVNAAQGTAGVSAPNQKLQGVKLALARPCHLSLRVWPGYYEYSVDGDPIAQRDEKDFVPDGTLSLGTPPWEENVGDLRYSNMRVRKLPADRPPAADEARVKYYGDLVRQHPGEGHPFFCRAVAHHHLHQYDEAIADYRKAAELDRRLCAAVILVGVAQMDKGDYAAAEKQLELGVKTQPDSTLALRALAWLRATCPEDKYRDGAAATKHAQKACQLCQSADYLAVGALAAALAESGNFSEAVQQGKKTVDLAPEAEKAECRERLELYEKKEPYRQPRPSDKKP